MFFSKDAHDIRGLVNECEVMGLSSGRLPVRQLVQGQGVST